MKQLELNTWERIQLALCVPEQGFPQDFRAYVRLLDATELTPEEKVRVGWTETSVVQGGQPVINPRTGRPIINITVKEPDFIFELLFEDADFDNLMKLVNQRKTWAIRGSNRERTETLLNKLK